MQSSSEINLIEGLQAIVTTSLNDNVGKGGMGTPVNDDGDTGEICMGSSDEVIVNSGGIEDRSMGTLMNSSDVDNTSSYEGIL